MAKLSGKVAVITGGGSGIGRAIVELFAQEGAVVHIIDLNEEAVQLVVDSVHTDGGKAIAHICNVTSQTDVRTTIDTIGKIDILVNNAGIAHVGNRVNAFKLV